MNVVVFVGESGDIPIFGVETDEKIAMFPDAQSAFLYVIGRQLLHRQLRNVYVVDMNDAESPPEWWDDFPEHFLPRKFWPYVQPIAPPPAGTPRLESGTVAPAAAPAGGANWVTPKTRREVGSLYLVRQQANEDGVVTYVERNGEPLGHFLDDQDMTEAMTFVAARQILTESQDGVWMQRYWEPAAYPFPLFAQMFVPYDLVETARMTPQLSRGW